LNLARITQKQDHTPQTQPKTQESNDIKTGRYINNLINHI
jgi:hypothetical protein